MRREFGPRLRRNPTHQAGARCKDHLLRVFGHNITGRYWMMNNLMRYPGGDLIPRQADDGGPARTFWSRFWMRGRGAAAPWPS